MKYETVKYCVYPRITLENTMWLCGCEMD